MLCCSLSHEQEEAKKQEEAKGKIKFKLEYDFTTQELKVTVSQSSSVVEFTI